MVSQTIITDSDYIQRNDWQKCQFNFHANEFIGQLLPIIIIWFAFNDRTQININSELMEFSPIR